MPAMLERQRLMADTFQERYGQSVRCLICARPARRGATLCAQVKAAAPAPAAQPAPLADEARDATVAKSRPAMPSLAVDDVPASSRATDSQASYDTVGDEHVAIFQSLAPAPRAIPDRKAAREGKDSKQAVAPRRAANARNGAAALPPLAVAPTPAAVASTALPEPIAPDRFA